MRTQLMAWRGDAIFATCAQIGRRLRQRWLSNRQLGGPQRCPFISNSHLRVGKVNGRETARATDLEGVCDPLRHLLPLSPLLPRPLDVAQAARKRLMRLQQRPSRPVEYLWIWGLNVIADQPAVCAGLGSSPQSIQHGVGALIHEPNISPVMGISFRASFP